MSGPHGDCTPGLVPVRQLMTRRLGDGTDVGASVCVIQDGRVLADLWGGYADADTGRPWERDTLVNTYSLTKTMAALAVLKLIDDGELDPRQRVSYYWPEFAAAGKRDVLVRQVLSHTSGVCGWSRPVELEDLYDVPRAAAWLAEQEPWWQPGHGSGYQALTHGHLVDGIVRRITGRSLGEFLAAEFSGPSGADYWLGTPSSVDARVATLVAPAASGIDYAALPPESVFVKTMTNPVIPPSVATTRGFLAAELGAVNGQGNARSVATLQSIVSNGGVLDGRRYLSDRLLARIFDECTDSVDRVLGSRIRFGLGYALPTPEAMPEIPSGRVCWWTGFGGSVVVNDLDRRMTMAYVMNRMEPGLLGAANARAYLRAVYDCLG